MPLVVYQKGESFGMRSIGALLRDRHERHRKDTLAAIKKRSDSGVPLNDAKPCEKCGHQDPLKELADPGEYALDPALDDLEADFRVMDNKQFFEWVGRWGAASGQEGIDAFIAEFIVRGIVKLSGVETLDGVELTEPTQETAEILVSNRLGMHLWLACLHLHALPTEEKKTCGASQPSGSIASPATSAAPRSDSLGAATGAETGTPTFRASPSNPTPALAATS